MCASRSKDLVLVERDSDVEENNNAINKEEDIDEEQASRASYTLQT